jgi:hypothetical protein
LSDVAFVGSTSSPVFSAVTLLPVEQGRSHNIKLLLPYRSFLFIFYSPSSSAVALVCSGSN